MTDNRLVDSYFLDRAVMAFGTELEEALRQATAQGKRKKPMSDAQRIARTQEVMRRWLGEDVVKQRFRDPMMKFKQGAAAGD